MREKIVLSCEPKPQKKEEKKEKALRDVGSVAGAFCRKNSRSADHFDFC